jgi:hypothetical protein
MPEFFAQHTPADRGADSDFSDFFRGYVDCAEWLLPTDTGESDSINRDDIRGWSRSVVRTMRADCRDFYRANRADLLDYVETTGRGMESAGMDFYLTRERHGAGFWDRGHAACLTRLTDAAHGFGEFGYPWLSRGWLRLD